MFTGDSFTLVGRFAFNVARSNSQNINRVTISTTAPLAYEYLFVGFYYENWETWQDVQPESTCIEKISYATHLVCTNSNAANCARLPLDDNGESLVFPPLGWNAEVYTDSNTCLLYTSPSPRDRG